MLYPTELRAPKVEGRLMPTPDLLLRQGASESEQGQRYRHIQHQRFRAGVLFIKVRVG